MPRIPGIDYTTRAPGPVDQARKTAVNVGGPLAELGAAVGNFGAILKDEYDQSEATKFTANAQKRLQDLQFRLQNGSEDGDGNKIPPPNPDVHQQMFEQEVDDIRTEAQDSIGSGRAYRMFQTSFDDFSQKQKIQVMEGANEQYKSKIRNNLMDVLQVEAGSIVNAGEIEKPGIMSRAFKTIDNAEANGIMSHDQARAARTNLTHDVAMASYLKIVKQSPMDAITAIDNGEFRDLPVDAQAQLRNRAITEAESQQKTANMQEEKAIRDQAKIEKQSQDQVAKDGWAMKAQGKLTPKWVMENQDNLSKDDFKMLLGGAAGGDDVPTNKPVYSSLRIRAGRGEDVTEEATKAYKRGQFAREPYEKLLSEVETNSAGAQLKGTYKVGQKYLSTSLTPDPNNPAWSDLVAQTMDDWQNWSAENTSATPEQARAVYTRYAEEARLVGFQNTTIGNVVPMFWPGGSAAARTLPSKENLGVAYGKTKEAFEKGQISPFEKRRQMRIIESWKSFVKDDAELKKSESGK